MVKEHVGERRKATQHCHHAVEAYTHRAQEREGANHIMEQQPASSGHLKEAKLADRVQKAAGGPRSGCLSCEDFTLPP